MPVWCYRLEKIGVTLLLGIIASVTRDGQCRLTIRPLFHVVGERNACRAVKPDVVVL